MNEKTTIDAAVKGILDEAKNSDELLRLDEGSEYLHAFWLSVLIEMQKRKKFVGNQRVNLAGLVEGGGWAIFAITLVELIKPDGTSMENQLQNEKGEVQVKKNGDAS